MTSYTGNRLPLLMCLRKFSSVALALMLAVSAAGQAVQVQGSISVRVVDPAGAAVPGVAVVVTPAGTDRGTRKETNVQGVVRFDNLPPGTYNVTVASEELAEPQLKKVEVTVGAREQVEFRLRDKSQKSLRMTVPGTVAAAVEAVERTDDQRADTSALPNPNNDLSTFLQVVPGAVATGSSVLGRIVIDGKGREAQAVWLDGIEATPLAEVPSADPSIDPVGSFQKPEVAFDAGRSTPKTRPLDFVPKGGIIFGPGTGVVTEGITYDGTTNYAEKTDWKVQLYGEHRSEALGARNYFDLGDARTTPRRSRFGVRAGGPFLSEKTFAYLGYEGVRARIERDVFEAVPTDAACGGCVGGAVGPLLGGFIPRGTVLMPADTSLNPDFLVARRRLRTNVAANTADARLDFRPFFGEKDDENKPTLKSSSAFTLRFTRLAAQNLVPEGVTGRRQRQTLVFANAVANLLWVTEESTQNFKFGLNQTRAHVDVETPAGPGPSLASSLFTVGGTIKTARLPGHLATVPAASLGGLVRGLGRGYNLKPVSFIAGYDLFRILRDRHQMRLGVEVRFINLDYDRLGGLTYNFPNVAALRSGTPGTVAFLADLSAPSPFTAGTGPRHARQRYFMGYFQMHSPFGRAHDKDPATGEEKKTRLNLVYGFRYDYFGPVSERHDRAVVVDPETATILPPGAPFYRASKVNFQPRFGLEYRLAEKGFWEKTVLRTGVGLFSGAPRIGDFLLPIDSDRFSTGVTGGVFPSAPADAVREFVNNPLTRQFQPLAFARDFTTPERVFKWDASLTRTFDGYEVMLYYAGNIGQNLPLAGIANPIVSVANDPDPTRPAVVVRRFDIVRGSDVFKPFGEFFFRSSKGRSSYNAMTVLFKRNKKVGTKVPAWLRPAVNDLTAQYVLGRNVGNASGAVASDPFDFDSDYGYNASDARHSLTLSTTYNLWDAKKRRQSNPLWGWRLAPLFKASTGLPLIVRLDRPDVVYVDADGKVFGAPGVGRSAVINTPGGGATGGARVPNLIPGADPYLRNGTELLNPAAFAIPKPGTLGNLRRGQLRGPATVQFDLSLTKFLFGSTENVLGDFRVDIFNVFNRANFNNTLATLPNSLGTNLADDQLQPGAPFTRAAAGTFGFFNVADPGRSIQFSVTLRFRGGFTK